MAEHVFDQAAAGDVWTRDAQLRRDVGLHLVHTAVSHQQSS